MTDFWESSMLNVTAISTGVDGKKNERSKWNFPSVFRKFATVHCICIFTANFIKRKNNIITPRVISKEMLRLGLPSWH